MRIITILGTRPEIIRLSRIIPLLDKNSDQILVHTGQNYDERLSDIFFAELGVRKPDRYLGIRTKSFGGQIGQILEKSEELFMQYHPDRLLILGDTNSGISAVIAKRLGITVYHMEAGNRCYDDRVPEEVNRRIIDHSSSILMPYTNRSKENLVREGIALNRIFVIGNPIKEVLDYYEPAITASRILDDLEVETGKYFLVTMHRAENVDREERLRSLVDALTKLSQRYGFPVIGSFHPRTKSKVESFGINIDQTGLKFVPPFGFFDFIRLEKSAFCVLSDSGTVQEETCIFGVPNVTIRDTTERPETLECGSNVLSGVDPSSILNLVEMATSQQVSRQCPPEYLTPHVAATVGRICLGYHDPELSELYWQNNTQKWMP